MHLLREEKVDFCYLACVLFCFVEMLQISELVKETSLLYSFFSRIQSTQQVKKTDYIITISFLFYVAVFVNCETPWEHFAFFLNLAC